MRSIGPYQVTAEIGRGGMGTVYRGWDPALQRPVAIKVIEIRTADAEEKNDLRMRFAVEARAAARLSHPNIVAVHYFGQENDQQFLVMELVEGASFTRLVRTTRPAEPDTVQLIAQVAAALDHAHANGVVHRDVKPANILVRGDGVVKVTDFGIAKLSMQSMTRTGIALGTPAYMAPEQIRGEELDGRADQFSLAVVAYQMLTGRLPFEAPSDHAILFKILQEPPLDPRALNPGLSQGSVVALARALSKRPQDRFPSCAEFARALVAASSGSIAAAPGSWIPPAPPPAPSGPPVPPWQPPADPMTRQETVGTSGKAWFIPRRLRLPLLLRFSLASGAAWLFGAVYGLKSFMRLYGARFFFPLDTPTIVLSAVAEAFAMGTRLPFAACILWAAASAAPRLIGIAILPRLEMPLETNFFASALLAGVLQALILRRETKAPALWAIVPTLCAGLALGFSSVVYHRGSEGVEYRILAGLTYGALQSLALYVFKEKGKGAR